MWPLHPFEPEDGEIETKIERAGSRPRYVGRYTLKRDLGSSHPRACLSVISPQTRFHVGREENRDKIITAI
jgi:hypothetical protein